MLSLIWERFLSLIIYITHISFHSLIYSLSLAPRRGLTLLLIHSLSLHGEVSLSYLFTLSRSTAKSHVG